MAVVYLGMAVLPLNAIAANSLSVAVSVKPVHSLVAGIMDGIGEPFLVVKGGASPHDFVLRPSTAKALARADLVIWVGPALEPFLRKPLASIETGARVVAVGADPSLKILSAKDDDHGHGAIDQHVWLAPENARAIVGIAVRELSALDPERAALYRRNGIRVARRIDALDRDLAAQLAPVAPVPFLVFHDAYRYLVETYGLNAVGFVAETPDRAPGARHIHNLSLKMRRMRVRCVFREPGFEPKILSVLTREPDVEVGVLDPLGATLESGPELYFRMMRRNATVLAGCLGKAGGG